MTDDIVHLAQALKLPFSIAQVLWGRGFATPDQATAFLDPSLKQLSSPDAFPQMKRAVERLRQAIRQEEPIAIYADRDVDGLTGLTILVRTLRCLGGTVYWGSPAKGRGIEHAVLESLVQRKANVCIFVDCGTAEETELSWLATQGVDVIVADHHRSPSLRPAALAWIHPDTLEPDSKEAPAGCVMAFKLAHALWISFLGDADPDRLDYFLFEHLDLVCLGILADRMPLVGENRVLVWHGLRRLAQSRKVGLSQLTRFFRLTPRVGPLTVRQASWQLIPLLNAAGRLGHPEITAELLLTEDPSVARHCIDQLLVFNQQRRVAQEKSVGLFEKSILEQCSIETDPVLVAIASGLEPSVTGLTAQNLAHKYGRPVFLFVEQAGEAVGSGRGLPGVDLFAWVENHRQGVIKFGGHPGAVGLTIRTHDFKVFREGLLQEGWRHDFSGAEVSPAIEAEIALSEINEAWWDHFQRLEPLGPGFPCPLFRLKGVECKVPVLGKNSKPSNKVVLKGGSVELMVEVSSTTLGSFPGDHEMHIGYPVSGRKDEGLFKWVVQSVGEVSHV